MPSWDDYRYFLAVTREGSLAAAARSLGVSQPTVSRRMEQLELDVGVRLLSRDGPRLSPTPAGQEVVRFARSIEKEVSAIDQCLARRLRGPRTEVRLATTRGLASYWLAPLLADLESRASIRLVVYVSLGFVDLGHYCADVAVRMGQPGDDALHGRRVGAAHCGLYAARSYLEEYGEPDSLPDLANHLVIGSAGELPRLQQNRKLAEFVSCSESVAADCVAVQIAIVRQGRGIATLPCFMADAHEELVRVLPKAFDVPVDLWVLMNPDLKTDPVVREVFDFLVNRACAASDAFQGAAGLCSTPRSLRPVRARSMSKSGATASPGEGTGPATLWAGAPEISEGG